MLAACGRPTALAEQSARPADTAATQAAFFVQTEIARPTRTPTVYHTPTAYVLATLTPQPATETAPAGATQAPADIRVTAQPGLALYTYPEIPDYVFQIDPKLWAKDSSGETSNLVHKTIMGCGIASVPGHGLGQPKRLLWEDYGQFRWEILDYGANAYVVPVSGASLGGQSGSFINLQGYNLSNCRADQETVLADLLTRGEAAGEAGRALFASPTPRPALEGFSCPDTPPARLRVGDEVSVITDGLWLRSAPQAGDSTKIRKFLRNAPVEIRVVNGPVCEKYVYWQVEISSFGEGSETTQGWLAEGDLQEYYLTVVK